MPNPIAEALSLMESWTPQARHNVRDIYLAQYGAAIIPCCIAAYGVVKDSGFRSDLLRFVLRYARDRQEVVAFAIGALNDRSNRVRESACAVLAFSGSEAAVEPLKAIAARGKEPTATHAKNALLAISEKNHNLYYPTHHVWIVTPDDPTQPREESVRDFIEKPYPHLMAEIRRLFGARADHAPN